MRAQTIIVICALAAAGNANAQDAAAQAAQTQRALQAMQPLANQRNAAFDQLALCMGDTDALRAELAAAKAEIDKLKTKDPAK